MASPVLPAAPTPIQVVEEVAKPIDAPALVQDRGPLPRRIFKKKPTEAIEAHLLAGKPAVEVEKVRGPKRAPPIEETIELDSPEERIDPNDAVLSDREFYRTVHDWDGFSECLAKERTRREIGSGAMRLLYKISPSGKVLKVKAITPSGEGALAIVPCVEKKAAKMRFAPLADQEPVKKIAKFVWVANGTMVDVDRELKSL